MLDPKNSLLHPRTRLERRRFSNLLARVCFAIMMIMSQERPTLVIICGLPGAGKTTLAKKLAEEMRGVRFCPDEWMQDLGVSLWEEAFRDKLEKRFWKLSQELLKLGQTVILEYGFWAKSERNEKLQVARRLGVRTELHYLDISNDELRRRLKKRGMEGDNEILNGKLEKWAEDFERPGDAEFKLYDNYSTDS